MDLHVMGEEREAVRVAAKKVNLRLWVIRVPYGDRRLWAFW